MKKLTALLLILILLPFPVLSEELPEPAAYMTNYLLWATLFAASDLDTDLKIYKQEDDIFILAADCLAVFYNSENLILSSMFVYGGKMSKGLEGDLRATALFAASELGEPREAAKEVVDEALEIVTPIYDGLMDGINNNAEDIKAGKHVVFFVSDNHYYAVYQQADTDYYIINVY